MDHSDRRQHARRPLEQEVLCYIDGGRLDSRTADISAGGLFLRTERYQNFPEGAVVAIVFEEAGIPPGTAFLFARVMRHQSAPRPGVGLQWERAVGAGSPEPLKRVLKRLFAFPDPRLEARDVPERGLTQFVFRFPPAPSLELDRPASTARQRISVAMPKPEPRAEAPAVVQGRPAAEAPRTPGPLTTQIDSRGARQAVDLPATLEAAGFPIQVRLRWIGLGAAGLDCPWVPVDPDMPLLLRFEIPTREGAVAIRCNARVRSSDLGKGGRSPTVDLALKDIDEGGQGGLLVRYLKWMAIRQMSRD